jgi:GNAT superfamily N-acetyltransferase
MTEAPTSPTPPRPAAKIALLRAERPTLSFYRYLYNTIGEDWMWYLRREMDDETVLSIIHHEDVQIHVLYVDGAPAGFCELDYREAPDMQLSFIGLLPEFIGRGLGRFFLRWAIDQAWTFNPKRLWMNTCTEDHPNALPMYQRAGFVVYAQETIEIDDPRDRGLFGNAGKN